MLRFELEIPPGDSDHTIQGFDRGHMTISGSQSLATSKAKQPDQSMMIFPSIVELLDGIRRFVMTSNANDYRFVGVDSSFQFTATKLEGDHIMLTGDQGVIDKVQTTDLIKAVWEGVDVFLSRSGVSLRSDDPVADDLRSAADDFRRELSPHLDH